MKPALIIAAAAVAVVASVSCGGGLRESPRGGSFGPDAGTPTGTGAPCPIARASEDLSPRSDLIGLAGAAPPETLAVQTSDLFARFRAICGDCHVAQSNGGRHVDEASFATAFDETWLVPVKSNDPKKYMPPAPGGKAFADRPPGDPVVLLVAYLEGWLEQGRPKTMFTVDAAAIGANTSSGYMFTPELASAMTNLGNCVPSPEEYANTPSGMMESMDESFAGATSLPQSLSETDLTSFDSQVLAETGVIAYAPTYPLWSAGSGKLRHIRVPKGQSVKFDKQKQSFDIPPNTRFYKTFFRKVVDRTGHLRNRKMETRLIVARPDQDGPEGAVQTALFGTYIWSEDETTALLANLTYRDGTVHADQIRAYITDELAYQEVVDSVAPGADFQGQLKLALDRALDGNPTLQQHYAIPGRIRCVQCHMGSPTKNFVLGFFPIQVARRESDTGGTYEPTGEDELSQLQRLIDYGVITGMSSPSDVVPLEESQGKRKPRTDAELKAQAYMVGNCAHCHNPRGLPSIAKPELTTALNFLPDREDGGVFEMSFERMSPVRARGANGDIPMPYITPSLYDYPVATTGLHRMDNGSLLTTDGSTGETTELTWSPKYFPTEGCSSDSPNTRGYCGARKLGGTSATFILAPWRSLIYRNVDTPFLYYDDYVPFPHMPMNTAGFDCRAPRIMGDWMVGLPAARKFPEIIESWIPFDGSKPGDRTYDDSFQPYREVKPGDLNEDGIYAYPDSLVDAEARLASYHASVRYKYCEEDLSPDIFDPLKVGPEYVPDPRRFVYGEAGEPTKDPKHPKDNLPRLGVPYHGHWFNYDPTDAPPPWSPRRPDWDHILPPGSPPDTSLPAGGISLDSVARPRKILAQALNEAQLTAELQTWAKAEIPIGLWEAKPECTQKLASVPKVSDFTGKRPPWMDKANPDAAAPVYMSAPGATLYRHICFNCHGANADGHGLQADALAASSNGEAQPANFREGLFGPSMQPGANLARTFVVPGTPNIDALGWGSRYMAWMSLGGTLKLIPQNIIRQVETTRVLGVRRRNLQYLPASNQASANMLNLAKGLCSVVLPDPSKSNGFYFRQYGGFDDHYPPYNAAPEFTPFIESNGDKEMWIHLCAHFAPPVVRVYSIINPEKMERYLQLTAMYYADGDETHPAYPTGSPVLDHNKKVQTGVQPDNTYPACFIAPANSEAQVWVASNPDWAPLRQVPCPAPFIASGKLLWNVSTLEDSEAGEAQADNITRWELRGAIAAGMAVFTYLQSGGAQSTLKPYYNECQFLK